MRINISFRDIALRETLCLRKRQRIQLLIYVEILAVPNLEEAFS